MHSSSQKWGMQVHSSHNRMSACTSAQNTRAPPASHQHREQCPSHQSPFRLLLISGHSQAWQHGSQRGAAHARSPPQVPGSTTTLRDLQSVTRSIKKKKFGKGWGRVYRRGKSAVLRVSRSTTSLRGRPLCVRLPAGVPRARVGTGVGPRGWQGGEDRGAPETVPLAWRPLIAPTASFTVSVCVCVSTARVCVKHHKPGQGRGEVEGRERHAC